MDPLRQFDIAPHADGAAAVVLARQDVLPQGLRRPFVRVAGSASSIDALALHDREDILNFEACGHSARKALERAGLSLQDVHLFEYHDAFSVYAALALEAVGFAERGQGWKMASEGSITAQWTCSGGYHGRTESTGLPRWRHRRLSGR